jgi:UPF0176 protein
MAVVVAALYHFVDFHDCEEWKERLLIFGNSLGIKGTMVFALEGLNGTVAGSRESIDKFLAMIRSDVRFAAMEHKESFAETMTFVRLRISVKNEICTMRVPEAKPSEIVGEYVDPQDWNDLISDPDVLVLDTRNDYEVGIGTFKGAVNPSTRAFCEFPDYVRKSGVDKTKKVAMFCTGGIRCEKASSFMRREGYGKVFHLKGGILKYLEQVPAEKSLWDGECYVFDRRVAVGQGLAPGTHAACFACRAVLSQEDLASEHHVEGVQCVKCKDDVARVSEKSRSRSMARQRQIDLCTRRGGVAHLGQPFVKDKKSRTDNVEAATTSTDGIPSVAGTQTKDGCAAEFADIESRV